jgi:hypothetical protein
MLIFVSHVNPAVFQTHYLTGFLGFVGWIGYPTLCLRGIEFRVKKKINKINFESPNKKLPVL